MQIRILPATTPPGKLADAELVFDDSDGPLAGLRLIGFSIWTRRSPSGGYSVTFPARSFSVNGERRSFALLRPTSATSENAATTVRDLIIEAYLAWEAEGQARAAKPAPLFPPSAERAFNNRHED